MKKELAEWINKQFLSPIKPKNNHDFSGVTRYGEDCCSKTWDPSVIKQLLELYGTRKDVDDHAINQEK